jgi:ribosome maturation factor RimP
MWGKLPTFFYSRGTPRHDVNEALEDVVTAELDAAGFDLVELRRGGSKSRPLVEVRIDRRDGTSVSVDDCARVSRVLEARLDPSGLVPEQYVLQVSSPGDRPLRTPTEWKRFVGRWVSVLAPEHGGRFEAKVVGLAGDSGSEIVTLDVDGKDRQIPLGAVKEARLAFRTSGSPKR